MEERKYEVQSEYGIQETIDVMRALRSLSVDIIDAFEDGVQISDFSVLARNFGPLKTALDGITDINKELNDLSPMEMKQLIGEAFDFVYAIRQAIINKNN